MTRKHFVLIAETLRKLKPTDKSQMGMWLKCVEEMAAMCAKANGNFQYQRFYDACGYNDE